MAEDTFHRVEALFAEALEIPVDEREAWLAARCVGDPETLQTVRKLLDCHHKAGSFLEAPALDFVGQTFGAYRATAEIGRGGMSVVYRGERMDGDFSREVAIKVLLLQAAGGASVDELRILAALDHPNIARLIDSGVSDLGFRYLILEYVDGVPCTAYEGATTSEQKLRLFLEVCHAVQYAHGALFIHRDLKPDNILISKSGSLKVLDFGIAKMLKTEGTQTAGLRAYTLDYASPEQILGLAANTSNDIYSLGVLLCEWLGGALPRRLQGLDLGTIVGIVNQEEVKDIPFQGDLYAIARKCLWRDATLRYASVGALIRDIERFLANEPVEAREPSFAYRAGKFIARYRYATAFGTAAALALAATAGIAYWQAREAQRRFDEVRSLARSMMFEVHDAVAPLPGSLAARKLIASRSLNYLDSLARDTTSRTDVQWDAAQGFLRLAEIQGRNGETASLGDAADALALSRRALALARSVDASSRTTESRQLLFRSVFALAEALANKGEYADSLLLAREAVDIAAGLRQAAPKDDEALSRYASAALLHADVLVTTGGSDAGKAYLQAETLARTALSARPESPYVRARLARVYNYLTGFHYNAKRTSEALRYNNMALELSSKLYAENPRGYLAQYASDIGQSAALLTQQKKFPEAISAYEEQLRLRRELLARDASDAVTALRVAATTDRIGFTYQQAGEFPKAMEWGEKALAQSTELYKKDPTNIDVQVEHFFCLKDLAVSNMGAKQRPRACQLASQAIELGKKSPALEGEVGSHWKQIQKLRESCSQR